MGYRKAPALWAFGSWGRHSAFVSSKFPDGDAYRRPWREHFSCSLSFWVGRTWLTAQDIQGCTGMYGECEDGCGRGTAWLRVKCRRGCRREEREDKNRCKKQKKKGRKYSSVPRHLPALSHFLFHTVIVFLGVLRTTCVPCMYVWSRGCRCAL